MTKYLNATDTLNKLKDKKLVTFGAMSFSEAVTAGVIPHHRVHGYNKRMFIYKEVKAAILKAGIGKPPGQTRAVKPKTQLKGTQTDDDYLKEIQKRFNGSPTITDANIINTITKARREQLKLKEELGLLISKTEVEDKAFIASRNIRDKLLSMPEKLSNEFSSINDAHTIKELFYKEINIILDGFSKDSFL